MNLRCLALGVAIIFLLQSGCATFNRDHTSTRSAYSENATTDFRTQWQKDEREWLLMVLILLGVAIVVGGTIAASSGSGGLFVGISN